MTTRSEILAKQEDTAVIPIYSVVESLTDVQRAVLIVRTLQFASDFEAEVFGIQSERDLASALRISNLYCDSRCNFVIIKPHNSPHRVQNDAVSPTTITGNRNIWHTVDEAEDNETLGDTYLVFLRFLIEAFETLHFHVSSPTTRLPILRGNREIPMKTSQEVGGASLSLTEVLARFSDELARTLQYVRTEYLRFRSQRLDLLRSREKLQHDLASLRHSESPASVILRSTPTASTPSLTPERKSTPSGAQSPSYRTHLAGRVASPSRTRAVPQTTNDAASRMSLVLLKGLQRSLLADVNRILTLPTQRSLLSTFEIVGTRVIKSSAYQRGESGFSSTETLDNILDGMFKSKLDGPHDQDSNMPPLNPSTGDTPRPIVPSTATDREVVDLANHESMMHNKEEPLTAPKAKEQHPTVDRVCSSAEVYYKDKTESICTQTDDDHPKISALSHAPAEGQPSPLYATRSYITSDTNTSSLPSEPRSDVSNPSLNDRSSVTLSQPSQITTTSGTSATESVAASVPELTTSSSSTSTSTSTPLSEPVPTTACIHPHIDIAGERRRSLRLAMFKLRDHLLELESQPGYQVSPEQQLAVNNALAALYDASIEPNIITRSKLDLHSDVQMHTVRSRLADILSRLIAQVQNPKLPSPGMLKSESDEWRLGDLDNLRGLMDNPEWKVDERIPHDDLVKINSLLRAAITTIEANDKSGNLGMSIERFREHMCSTDTPTSTILVMIEQLKNIVSAMNEAV